MKIGVFTPYGFYNEKSLSTKPIHGTLPYAETLGAEASELRVAERALSRTMTMVAFVFREYPNIEQQKLV